MDVFSTRDVDAIADLYHPGAVLTRSDGLCFYGRDGKQFVLSRRFARSYTVQP